MQKWVLEPQVMVIRNSKEAEQKQRKEKSLIMYEGMI